MIVLFGILLAHVGQAQIKEVTVIDTMNENGLDYVRVSLDYRRLSTVKTVIEFKTFPRLIPEFIKGQRFLFAKEIQIKEYTWSYNQSSGNYYWKPTGTVKGLNWVDVHHQYFE